MEFHNSLAQRFKSALHEDVDLLINSFFLQVSYYQKPCNLETFKHVWTQLRFSSVHEAIPESTSYADHLQTLYSAAIKWLHASEEDILKVASPLTHLGIECPQLSAAAGGVSASLLDEVLEVRRDLNAATCIEVASNPRQENTLQQSTAGPYSLSASAFPELLPPATTAAGTAADEIGLVGWTTTATAAVASCAATSNPPSVLSQQISSAYHDIKTTGGHYQYHYSGVGQSEAVEHSSHHHSDDILVNDAVATDSLLLADVAAGANEPAMYNVSIIDDDSIRTTADVAAGYAANAADDAADDADNNVMMQSLDQLLDLLDKELRGGMVENGQGGRTTSRGIAENATAAAATAMTADYDECAILAHTDAEVPSASSHQPQLSLILSTAADDTSDLLAGIAGPAAPIIADTNDNSEFLRPRLLLGADEANHTTCAGVVDGGRGLYDYGRHNNNNNDHSSNYNDSHNVRKAAGCNDHNHQLSNDSHNVRKAAGCNDHNHQLSNDSHNVRKAAGCNDHNHQLSNAQITIGAAVLFTLYSLYRTQLTRDYYFEDSSGGGLGGQQPASIAVGSSSSSSSRGAPSFSPVASTAAILLGKAVSTDGTTGPEYDDSNRLADAWMTANTTANNGDSPPLGADLCDGGHHFARHLVRICLPLHSLDTLVLSYIPSFQTTAAHQALRVLKIMWEGGIFLVGALQYQGTNSLMLHNFYQINSSLSICKKGSSSTYRNNASWYQHRTDVPVATSLLVNKSLLDDRDLRDAFFHLRSDLRSLTDFSHLETVCREYVDSRRVMFSRQHIRSREHPSSVYDDSTTTIIADAALNVPRTAAAAAADLADHAGVVAADVSAESTVAINKRLLLQQVNEQPQQMRHQQGAGRPIIHDDCNDYSRLQRCDNSSSGRHQVNYYHAAAYAAGIAGEISSYYNTPCLQDDPPAVLFPNLYVRDFQNQVLHYNKEVQAQYFISKKDNSAAALSSNHIRASAKSSIAAADEEQRGHPANELLVGKQRMAAERVIIMGGDCLRRQQMRSHYQDGVVGHLLAGHQELVAGADDYQLQQLAFDATAACLEGRSVIIPSTMMTGGGLAKRQKEALLIAKRRRDEACAVHNLWLAAYQDLTSVHSNNVLVAASGGSGGGRPGQANITVDHATAVQGDNYDEGPRGSSRLLAGKVSSSAAYYCSSSAAAADELLADHESDDDAMLLVNHALLGIKQQSYELQQKYNCQQSNGATEPLDSSLLPVCQQLRPKTKKRQRTRSLAAGSLSPLMMEDEADDDLLLDQEMDIAFGNTTYGLSRHSTSPHKAGSSSAYYKSCMKRKAGGQLGLHPSSQLSQRPLFGELKTNQEHCSVSHGNNNKHHDKTACLECNDESKTSALIQSSSNNDVEFETTVNHKNQTMLGSSNHDSIDSEYEVTLQQFNAVRDIILASNTPTTY
ncbi:hypothetical protein CEUSTIGMA_g12873.t1 [Chlamydomonas eustigma]|uniref:Uncharacterized protein n=1 Tax=Chlamydomonas eustigma TaxID=1157962 RepID=A0A250XQW2_9CHLO|nr:hypothetical protein CEUSTIGMA_g12873.t1 [Chlamydomonas eustigma]|eukprot:GAX85457.1 hypothetical protein CEUSTIGMA_g12873.t1 [Chlamydomonas eustigma]